MLLRRGLKRPIGERVSRSGTTERFLSTEVLAIRSMKHKTSRALFAYWDSVRGRRLAPRRFEIDPSRISTILPYTFILERRDAETFSFRLAGTRMCDIFGRELRGTNFLDGWEAIDRLPLLRQFSALVRQGTAGTVGLELAATGEEPVECEVLLLPLRHTRETIDRVLGSFSPLQSPSWLGEKPIVSKRITANELVWPSRDPLETISQPKEPPALAPLHSTRIVRSERRQFRVFDGGLLTRSDCDKG